MGLFEDPDVNVPTLQDECVDESNNVLRFVNFANMHYQDWRKNDANPLPIHISFLDAY